MENQYQSHSSRFQYIILAVAIILFAVMSAFFWDYSIDDSFITFKYAENFADGNGFVFNVGDNPVEGFSNLLWLFILAGFYLIGFSIPLTAKILGLLTMLASGLSWFFYFRKDSRAYLWLAGPLLLICPLTIFWGVSGLELGLHCLLLSLLVQLTLKKSYYGFIPAVLLILNRPEGIAIVGSLFFVLALSDYFNRQLKLKYYMIGFAVAVVTIGLLTLFRYDTFGYPLPNTFYAKTVYKNNGFYEFAIMMLRLLPFGLAFLWAIFESLKNKFRPKELSVVTGLFLVQVIISSSVDPVMNYMFRYLIPFLPLLIILTLFFILKFSNYKIKYIVIASILISFFMISFNLYAMNNSNKKIVHAQQDIIKYLNSKKPNQTVSLIDMGRIPYYTSQNYKDIWGLVDEKVGHRGFNPVSAFLQLSDYFIFVGSLSETGIEFAFWRDKQIASIAQFPSCYKLVKIGAPEGADYHQPGYYYLTFEKNEQAENIVNSFGIEYWQKKARE